MRRRIVVALVAAVGPALSLGAQESVTDSELAPRYESVARDFRLVAGGAGWTGSIPFR